MEVLVEEKERFRSMAKVGDIIYFLSFCGDELWMFDAKTKILKMGWKLSEKKDDVPYQKIIQYKDILFFVPGSANDIYTYNCKTGSTKKIPVPDINIHYYQQHKFSNAFYIDNRMIFLPFCYPAILTVDTESWQIDAYKISNGKESVVEAELFSGSYVLQKGKCYVPSAKSNEVLEIDINTYEMVTYKLGQEEAWYGTISSDGKNFWLTGKKNTITKWNVDDDVATEYEYPRNFERQEGDYPFLDSFLWKDKIVLIPAKSNMFIAIDKETGSVEKIHGTEEELRLPLIHSMSGQDRVLFDNVHSKLFCLEEKRKDIQIKRKWGLYTYILKIINNDFDGQNTANSCESTCGNRIHSICK